METFQPNACRAWTTLRRRDKQRLREIAHVLALPKPTTLREVLEQFVLAQMAIDAGQALGDLGAECNCALRAIEHGSTAS